MPGLVKTGRQGQHRGGRHAGPAGSTPLQNDRREQDRRQILRGHQSKPLPRIYQKEARRVARPLVFEHKEGFRPQVGYPHEMMQGIEAQLPPITGYVLTT